MLKTLYAYSGAIAEAARKGKIQALAGYDKIVVTDRGNQELQACHPTPEALESRLFRYIDYWGSPVYSVAESDVPRWTPGPGDLHPGFPRIESAKENFPFRIDKFHNRRLLYMCLNIMRAFPHQAGLFLDDFRPEANYWGVDARQRRIVWPDWKPGPWRADELAEFEHWLRTVASPRKQSVMVNGASAVEGEQCFESLGKWAKLSDLERANPGDTVIIKAYKADGKTYAKTSNEQFGGYPDGTSFRDVVLDGMEEAEKRGLAIALAYAEKPDHGGSTLGWHDFSDPSTWTDL